jgi:hypothetical protein
VALCYPRNLLSLVGTLLPTSHDVPTATLALAPGSDGNKDEGGDDEEILAPISDIDGTEGEDGDYDAVVLSLELLLDASEGHQSSGIPVMCVIWRPGHGPPSEKRTMTWTRRSWTR